MLKRWRAFIAAIKRFRINWKALDDWGERLFQMGWRLLLISLIFAFGLFVFRGIQTKGYAIQAFSMPKEMADSGFTGQVLARQLVDELMGIQNFVQSVKADALTRIQNQTEKPDLDVEVLGIGLTLNSITYHLRELLGIPNQSIGGDLTDIDGELELTLRMTSIPIQTFRYNYLNSSRKEGLEYLIHEVAKAIIAEIDPYRMAIYYQKRKQYEQGLQFVNKILKEKPEESEWAYVAWGNILDEQGKLKEAIQKFKQATEINPSFILAWSNQAWTEFRLENFEQATALFQEGIKVSKNDASAWNNLAFCLKWQKKYKEADAAYQKAIDLEPNGINWHLNLAYSKFEQGDTATVKHILNNLSKNTEAKGADYHFALFNYYNLLNKSEQAIDELETVLSLDNQHFHAIRYAVPIYFDNQEYHKTIKMGKYLIQLAPSNQHSVNLTYTTMDAYNTIAMAHYKLAQYDSAYFYVEQSIQQDSTSGMPYSTLAEIHGLTGKKEAFYEAAETSLKKGFNLWDFLQDEPYQEFYTKEARFRALIAKYQPKWVVSTINGTQ